MQVRQIDCRDANLKKTKLHLQPFLVQPANAAEDFVEEIGFRRSHQNHPFRLNHQIVTSVEAMVTPMANS